MNRVGAKVKRIGDFRIDYWQILPAKYCPVFPAVAGALL